jgi:hypothetical protein
MCLVSQGILVYTTVVRTLDTRTLGRQLRDQRHSELSKAIPLKRRPLSIRATMTLTTYHIRLRPSHTPHTQILQGTTSKYLDFHAIKLTAIRPHASPCWIAQKCNKICMQNRMQKCCPTTPPTRVSAACPIGCCCCPTCKEVHVVIVGGILGSLAHHQVRVHRYWCLQNLGLWRMAWPEPNVVRDSTVVRVPVPLMERGRRFNGIAQRTQ